MLGTWHLINFPSQALLRQLQLASDAVSWFCAALAYPACWTGHYAAGMFSCMEKKTALIIKPNVSGPVRDMDRSQLHGGGECSGPTLPQSRQSLLRACLGVWSGVLVSVCRID